jgi:hypothetical protein
MRILREHIRRAGWLALIALAINLGLSFGHVHTIDAKGVHHATSPWIVSFLSSYDGNSPGHLEPSHPAPNHPDDDLGDQLCPICVAMSGMASGLAPQQPAVSVEFTAALVDYAVIGTPDVRALHRSVFQSRGPPLS